MRNLLPFLVLFVVASAVQAFSNVQTQYDGPDEIELSLLEPAVVPDPVDGVSRWWYTPSQKAHIYRHKYPKNIQAQPRQGEDLRLSGDVYLAYIMFAFCLSSRLVTGQPTDMLKSSSTASDQPSTFP